MRFVLLLSVLSLYICSCQPTEEKLTADLIITNAVIWTGDQAQPEAEAIAIAADTILALGNTSDISSFRGAQTKVIDAEQQFITPGFIDCHVHFLTGGFRLASVQLRDAATPAEFIARIADHPFAA